MKPNLSQIGMGKEISVGGVGQALEPRVGVHGGGTCPAGTRPGLEDPFEKHSLLPRICQQKSERSPPPQPVRLGPAAVAQISAQLAHPLRPSPSPGWGDGDRVLMGWTHALRPSPSPGWGDGDGVLMG